MRKLRQLLAALTLCAAPYGIAAAQSSSPQSAPVTTAPVRGYSGLHYKVAAAMSTFGLKTDMSHPIVESIEAGSPAASSGLAVGDTIITVNDVDALRHGAMWPYVGVRQVFRVRRADGEHEFALVPIAIAHDLKHTP